MDEHPWWHWISQQSREPGNTKNDRQETALRPKVEIAWYCRRHHRNSEERDLNDFVKAKARVATHAIFDNVSSHPPTPPSAMKEKKKPSPLRPASPYGTKPAPIKWTKKPAKDASKSYVCFVILIIGSYNASISRLNPSMRAPSSYTPKTSALIVLFIAMLLVPAPRRVFVE